LDVTIKAEQIDKDLPENSKLSYSTPFWPRPFADVWGRNVMVFAPRAECETYHKNIVKKCTSFLFS
jgi:hypothetical protein